jgi:prolyl-tRNA synthetase
MGSYGIGVSRAVAAIVEQHFDEKGIIWPIKVAPAQIHLVATGKEDEVFDFANLIAEQLTQAQIKVIYDDRRGVSPGVKFNDSELLGMPIIVVVGKKLTEGLVEVKDRRSGKVEVVEKDKIVSYLNQLVNQQIQEMI